MMDKLKIKVKDVENFVKAHVVLFANGTGKKFYVKLHAGPKVKRYIVTKVSDNINKGFTNRGEAVRFFNSI